MAMLRGHDQPRADVSYNENWTYVAILKAFDVAEVELCDWSSVCLLLLHVLDTNTCKEGVLQWCWLPRLVVPHHLARGVLQSLGVP